MRRRRPIAVATVVMAVAVAVAGGALAVGAQDGGGVPPPLDDAAIRAVAELAVPSVADPLPGDLSVGEDLYAHDGACTEVRDAYLRPDAPVPEGATVREVGGALVVETPSRRSGIGFSTSGERCFYDVRPSPSLVVEGPGAIPPSDGFGEVGCLPVGDLQTMVAEVLPRGRPHVLTIGGEEGRFQALLMPVSLDRYAGLGGLPPGSKRWPATIEPRPTGGVATVDTPGGATTVTFRCTTGFAALLTGAAGLPPR